MMHPNNERVVYMINLDICDSSLSRSLVNVPIVLEDTARDLRTNATPTPARAVTCLLGGPLPPLPSPPLRRRLRRRRSPAAG